MPEIETIHNEARRGCGYRNPGGLYLMGGRLSHPCGKLPKYLETGPCCGGGIKATRGWTWITPSGLFEPGVCSIGEECGAERCCLYLPSDEKGGLIWIGEKFYSPDDFAEEAATLGVSRRIPAVPKGFEVGKTWVFFGHRKLGKKLVQCDLCTGTGQIGESKCNLCDGAGKVEKDRRGIFAAFRPDRIEYVVKEDDDDEKLERLEKRGVTLVRLTWDAPAGEREGE